MSLYLYKGQGGLAEVGIHKENHIKEQLGLLRASAQVAERYQQMIFMRCEHLLNQSEDIVSVEV